MVHKNYPKPDPSQPSAVELLRKYCADRGINYEDGEASITTACFIDELRLIDGKMYWAGTIGTNQRKFLKKVGVLDNNVNSTCKIDWDRVNYLLSIREKLEK